MAVIFAGGSPPMAAPLGAPVVPPVPLGSQGIHWFGPGGAGVSYPQPPRYGGGFPGQPVHLPVRPILGGGPVRATGPGLAHIAARRAGRRAIALRRALY